jgi:hypothetical protein
MKPELVSVEWSSFIRDRVFSRDSERWENRHKKQKTVGQVRKVKFK